VPEIMKNDFESRQSYDKESRVQFFGPPCIWFLLGSEHQNARLRLVCSVSV